MPDIDAKLDEEISKAAESLKIYVENLEKAGPGSRGGNVVGKTRSGKPIYATPSHTSHAGFSDEDHYDASAVHLHHAWQAEERGGKGSGKVFSRHADRSSEHSSQIKDESKRPKSEDNEKHAAHGKTLSEQGRAEASQERSEKRERAGKKQEEVAERQKERSRDKAYRSILGKSEEIEKGRGKDKTPRKKRTTSGKFIQDVEHSHYQTRQKVRGFNTEVSPLHSAAGGSTAGKMLRQRYSDFDKQDHKDAAEHHSKQEDEATNAWKNTKDAAEKKHYGKVRDLTEGYYTISGGVDPKYDETSNNKLRELSRKQTAHSQAADAHKNAAKGYRKMKKSEQESQMDELMQVINAFGKDGLKKATARLSDEQKELLGKILEKGRGKDIQPRKKRGSGVSINTPKFGEHKPPYSKASLGKMDKEAHNKLSKQHWDLHLKAEKEGMHADAIKHWGMSEMHSEHSVGTKEYKQRGNALHDELSNKKEHGNLHEIASNYHHRQASDKYGDATAGTVGSIEAGIKARAFKKEHFGKSEQESEMKDEKIDKAITLDKEAKYNSDYKTSDKKPQKGKEPLTEDVSNSEEGVDEWDEKFVPKAKEGATVRHQGGSGEDGAWEGQTIKSEQAEGIPFYKAVTPWQVVNYALNKAYAAGYTDFYFEKEAEQFKDLEKEIPSSEDSPQKVYKSFKNLTEKLTKGGAKDPRALAAWMSKACGYSEKLKKKQGVPKGVDAAKHERCVKDVKKQGKDVNPYAVCSASLQGKTKKSENGVGVEMKDLLKGYELPDVVSRMKERGLDRDRCIEKLSKMGYDRGHLYKTWDTKDQIEEVAKKIDPDADKGKAKGQKKKPMSSGDKKVEKSIKWNTHVPGLTLSKKSGHNCHYNVVDYIEKSEKAIDEAKKNGGWALDKSYENEPLSKSEKLLKTNVNDVIAKGEDKSETEVEDAARLAKAGKRSFTVQSFTDEDLAKSFGMSEEEYRKALGLPDKPIEKKPE